MLYIVATPIGNLEDITLRALRILKEADFILCEDTRVTKKLLSRYNIRKPLISYHQHSRLQKINFIIQLLQEGKNLALVSDAGTPGISDPGNKLISLLVDRFISLRDKDLRTYSEAELKNLITIIPVPGPSAVTAAISISGFPTDKFVFLGFPPHKKGRQKFFREVINSKYTVVLYESRYRILKTLNQLKETLNQRRGVVVACELTKKFEKIYRGTINEVIKKIETDIIKGEFVIVIGPSYGNYCH